MLLGVEGRHLLERDSACVCYGLKFWQGGISLCFFGSGYGLVWLGYRYGYGWDWEGVLIILCVPICMYERSHRSMHHYQYELRALTRVGGWFEPSTVLN
jgi:hypothetical protein